MDIFEPMAWKKELTARRYAKRGYATLKELITLNYGEWPLRGLNIATDEHLDQRVAITPVHRWWWRSVREQQPSTAARIKAILRATTSAFCFDGLAIHTGQREIVLNGFYRTLYYCCGQMITNRLLAHERRHVHQYDAVIPSRRVHLYGNNAGRQDVTTADAIVDDIVSTGIKYASPIRRLFVLLSYKLSNLMHEYTGKELKSIYYRRGTEIQARMEEFLTKGYPYWPHMPLNRSELYASLWNAGIRPPKRIRKQLIANPEFHLALQQFKAPFYKDMEAPHGLKMAVQQLPGNHVEDLFWNVALPALYGDIIESMGDREGRARMRDPYNEKNNRWIQEINKNLFALCLGNHLDACMNGDTSPTLENRIAYSANRIPPAVLAGYLAGLYDRVQEQANNRGGRDIPQGYKFFLLSCLKNPFVRDVLNEKKPPLLDWLKAQYGAGSRPRPQSSLTEPKPLKL